MKPHPLIAIAAWIAFWIALSALHQNAGSDTHASGAIALLVLPQFFLGLVAGRWPVAAAPISVGVVFAILAANEPNLSDVENAWILFLGIGVIAAIPVVAGAALSQWVARRWAHE